MNTLEFFNQNFGRHLVKQSGSAAADAQAALSSGHRMAKGGAPQRIASGWAIVHGSGATLQFKLAAQELQYSDATRYEAWVAAIEAFNGDPIMLLEFDKKPIPIINLRRTFDVRHICICSPGGIEIFDWTKEPTTKAHKALVKKRIEIENLNADKASKPIKSTA